MDTVSGLPGPFGVETRVDGGPRSVGELLGLVDGEGLVAFDRLARLASASAGVPVALAVMVDIDRQVFVGQSGLGEPWASRGETPLSHSFCQHVVASRRPLVVQDARSDDRVKSNLAVRDLGVVAYAGFPLISGQECVGSFCLIDHEPKTWTPSELEIAADFAALAADELALRIALAEQRDLVAGLRDSDRRYRSLIAAMTDGVVLQAQDGTILECNQAAEAILGLTADQMMGRSSLDPAWRSVRADGSEFPGVDHPAMFTLRTGQACRDVTMGVHKPSGELTWISISSEPLVGDHPELPYAVVCSFKDITEARNASLMLQRSERVARETADTLTAVLAAARRDAIVATNADGVVEVFNVGAEMILGASAAGIVGRPVRELFAHARLTLPHSGAAQQDDVAALREVALSDSQRTVQARWVRNSGTAVDLAMTLNSIRSAGGALAGYVGVAHDVTQSRALERELATEGERLRRANEELADYAHLVSHDLSEPLRAISGFAELLAEHNGGRLDDISDGYIARITGGVARMKTLIDALLAYAQAGNREIQREQVPVAGLVEDARAALSALIAERHVTINVDDLPTVEGDAMLLRQLVQNLLANAIKFSDATNPEVCVSSRRAHGRCEILVSDNGIGIEPRHHERIFKPFQQLNKRDQYPGSGIGLAICRRIVDRHGGEITVGAPAGGQPGSVFCFSVPDLPRLTDRDAST